MEQEGESEVLSGEDQKTSSTENTADETAEKEPNTESTTEQETDSSDLPVEEGSKTPIENTVDETAEKEPNKESITEQETESDMPVNDSKTPTENTTDEITEKEPDIEPDTEPETGPITQDHVGKTVEGGNGDHVTASECTSKPQTSTKMDLKEKLRGPLGKTADFLIWVVIMWLVVNSFRKGYQKKEITTRNPISDAQAIRNAKLASLPEAPPSPKPIMPPRDPSPLQYDTHEKFILVGGFPGAGTSLMRAILDAHPDVRCGNGKDIIYKLMQMWRNVAYSKVQLERMKLGGVHEKVIDISMVLFLLEILVHNGPPAPRLCTKDPLSMMGGRFLVHIFQKVKIVFLIRDVRAAAYSIYKNKRTVMGEKITTIEKAAKILDHLIQTMRTECHLMGVDHCLPVRYENLVLYPRETMEKVLKFLDLPWKEEVLHHYHYVNRTGVFSEPNSNDSDPIYDSSLTTWVGQIPAYLSDHHSYHFRHLEFLGYDPVAFPPDYTRLPRYNWTSPEEPTPIYKKDKERFLRLLAKVAAADAGIVVEQPTVIKH